MRELDSSMTPTGNTFTGTIDDNTGSFSIKGTLTNKIVELSALGYYFNEVSGSLSNATLTLSALSDLTDSSSSEKASYKSEYDSNASQMDSHESSFKLWDMLTLAGLGWETYLLLTDDSEETAVNYRNSSLPFIPRLAFKTHSSETQTVLLWKWRF